jgi:L-amino acid N-acyltransferase YncA
LDFIRKIGAVAEDVDVHVCWPDPPTMTVPTIRRATAEDAAAVASIYAPFCDTNAVSFEEAAPPADEMSRRIETIGAERPWIVLEDGDLVGYAYAARHHERAAYRWSATTAIYVDGAHRRCGAGRALYTTLLSLLRQLGYHTATAGVTLPNPASVGLHEACGFSMVGVYRNIGYKLGQWHDVAWYQTVIQPPLKDPASPRVIADLVGTAGWNEAVARGLQHYARHE